MDRLYNDDRKSNSKKKATNRGMAGNILHLGEVSEMFTQLLTILFGLVVIAVLAFFVVWALKVIFKGR